MMVKIFLHVNIVFLIWFGLLSCQQQPVVATKNSSLFGEKIDLNRSASLQEDDSMITNNNLDVEMIPYSEQQGYYQEKTRGPKYLTVSLKNKGPIREDGLSFEFFLTDTARVVTEELLQSPRFVSCPLGEDFSLAPQQECVILLESVPLNISASRKGFLEVQQFGLVQKTVLLGNSHRLYAGGDFYNPLDSRYRGLAYFEDSSWVYPIQLAGTVSTLATDHRMQLYLADYDSSRDHASLKVWDGSQLSTWGETAGAIEVVYPGEGTETLYIGGSFSGFGGASDANYMAQTALYNRQIPAYWQGVRGGALGRTVRALAGSSFLTSQEKVYALQMRYRLPTEAPETNVYQIKTPLVKIFSIRNDLNRKLTQLSVQLTTDVGSQQTLAFTKDPQFYREGAEICSLETEFTLEVGQECLVVVQGSVPEGYVTVGHTDNAALTFLFQGKALKTFSLARIHVLYAGGTFTHAPHTQGLVSAAYVARFDGHEWLPLGKSSIGLQPAATATVNSLAVDRLGRVYLGGAFSTLALSGATNGQTASNVARWEGEDAWRALGKNLGLNREVLTLKYQAETDRLLVGGRFIGESGGSGQQLWKLAAYQPASDQWLAVGNFKTNDETYDAVYTILDDLSGNDLYIAGHFSQLVTGGVPTTTYHGARYVVSTNQWSSWLNPVGLATGKLPTYYALAGVSYVKNGISWPHIYGGGIFDETPFSQASSPGFVAISHESENVSYYRGPVGGVLDAYKDVPPIYALLLYWLNVHDTAQLYGVAGGDFSQIKFFQTTPSVASTNFLAAWRVQLRNESPAAAAYPYCDNIYCRTFVGDTPTDFGGTDGTVRALLRLAPPQPSPLHGSIYLGGSFSRAGTEEASGVALLSRDVPTGDALLTAVGNGLTGGEVRALAAGHVVDVQEIDDPFTTLEVKIQPYKETAGYYVDALTRGPLFQMITVKNQGENTISDLGVGVEFLQAAGRLTIEGDPSFYNGHHICPINESFTLKSQSQCLILVRGTEQATAWGDSPSGTVVLTLKGLPVKAYTFVHKARLVAGGDFNKVVVENKDYQALHTAVFDGQAWQPLAVNAGNILQADERNTVRSLLTTPTGWLVAGGFYQVNNTAGERVLFGVAHWGKNTQGVGLWYDFDQTQHSGIQGGVVRALSNRYSSGIFVGGEDLRFETQTGPAQHVATFEQGHWYGLGSSPLNGPVYTLVPMALGDSWLYAGGNFTSVGGTSLPFVGRFDVLSKRWLSLGSAGKGLNGPVYSLVTVQKLEGSVYNARQ